MSGSPHDAFPGDLPDALRTVRTRPLFVMRLDVRPLQIVGGTPAGQRRIGVVFGGSFAGERLSGEVLDGGNDWQVLRADGVLALDVRLVLSKSSVGATHDERVSTDSEAKSIRLPNDWRRGFHPRYVCFREGLLS